MGSASSSIFEQRLKYFRETEDLVSYDTLGKFQTVHDHLTHKMLLKQKIQVTTSSEAETQLFLDRFKQSHQNLIQLEGYIKHGESEYQIYFEHFDSTLQKDLTEREQEGAYYTEDEIFSILRNIMSALIYMDKNGIDTGDISLENIVRSGLSYKLFDSMLVNIFAKSLSGSKKQDSQDKKTVTFRKMSQIGNILLQIFNLDAHNKHDKATKISNASERYSKNLVELAQKMLDNATENPEDLISWNKLIEDEFHSISI